MKTAFTLLGLFLFSIWGTSQSTIYGKVINEETGEQLSFANVVVFQNDIFVAGCTVDIEGSFQIPVPPGKYEIKASYTGFADYKTQGVIVRKNKDTELNIKFSSQAFACIYNIVTGVNIPLIAQDELTTKQKIDAPQIAKSPSKDINEIILNTPGVAIDNF